MTWQRQTARPIESFYLTNLTSGIRLFGLSSSNLDPNARRSILVPNVWKFYVHMYVEAVVTDVDEPQTKHVRFHPKIYLFPALMRLMSVG